MSWRSSCSRHLERLAELAHVELLRLARGLDQEAGERDEPGEALGPDRRLVAVVVVVGLRLAARRDRRGRLERLAVALDHELEPLARLAGELVGRLDAGLLAEPEHPGDHLARVGVVGLEDDALVGLA